VHRWAYADVRAHVLEAAQHISAREAERRVLILENPALRGTSQVTANLYAGLQLIMPGETAPAHRHTQSALRFIVEGEGAYTTVDDRKVPMAPGDLVITPAWRWHLHGNDSDRPMVWLDGLDIPMALYFGGTFREDEDSRRESAGVGGTSTPNAAALPPIHFPYGETRASLEAMASKGKPDAHLGHWMRFEDPATGGWAMPTMAPSIRLLPRGFASRPYRSTDSIVCAVVEGHGRLRAGDRDLPLAPHDVFVVPGWQAHTLEARDDLVVFAYSERAAQEKLGFFRDERL
jgi:gentisate 1,2-dioxygenase